jgi:DNA-binding MarR family transcriptional regulator
MAAESREQPTPPSDALPGDRVAEYRRLLHDRLLADGAAPDEADRAQLVFSLVRLLTRLGQDYEAAHRRLGWSWSGFRLLNILWAVGPMESRELVRASGSSRANVASLLNTLERDGLIERARSVGDRRQVVVRLTAHGESRLHEGMRVQADCDRRWFSMLTPQQESVAEEILTALADQPRPFDTT